jgi:hypothetical protein
VQQDLFTARNSFANAWGDFDNDSDLDFAASLGDGEVRLYRNDNGVFSSVGLTMGMPQAGHQQLRGLSWGDYDGDGFIDLIGGAFQRDHVTVVLKNEGGERFTDVALALGLTIPDRSSRPTDWVDFDNDGRLDVYATDRGGPNSLYRNSGATFTPVPSGPNDPRATVGSCWFDMNYDGHLDVFTANQSGAADGMWRNNGDGTFTDVAAELGMSGPTRTTAEGGVGCSLGDYDNDGHLDLFVANYGHNQLYRNNGNGTFTDVATEAGIDVVNHAVSADWGDYDNDGNLDLFIASYTGSTPNQQAANALFRNDGNGRFVNILANDSPLNTADHSAQFVDYDGDGGLDLSLTKGYTTDGGHFLFRNMLPDQAKLRSLSVTVLDANGRHTRFGAEIRLYDTAGRILATRPVVTGGGYNSQMAAPVHFGLRSMASVHVEVTFITRNGRMKQTLTDVNPAEYNGSGLVIHEAR